MIARMRRLAVLHHSNRDMEVLHSNSMDSHLSNSMVRLHSNNTDNLHKEANTELLHSNNMERQVVTNRYVYYRIH
jgi:hypothetical protein